LNLGTGSLNRWPPGAKAGPASIVFLVAKGENVAMTIEAKTDRSRDIAPDWAPPARRRGECMDWAEKPRVTEESGEELVFPPISPPPVWPRVFPGI
jgi:hypothetical protein